MSKRRPYLGIYHVGRFAHPDDVQLIDGPFTQHMREHGYAQHCIAQYRYHLLRVAGWLATKRRRLTSLARSEVPGLVRKFAPDGSRAAYAGVMHRWLRFRHCYHVEPREPWIGWLADFATFLKEHRGFKRLTAEGYVAFARRYLTWQFGGCEAKWSAVRAEHIWRYAELCAEGHKATYTKSRLGALRRFLDYVHLRGACPAQLVAAVPRLPNYRQQYSPGGLTGTQWRKLLKSFDRQSAQGCCEHAAAVCMLELGLRNCEVVQLRLPDIDWDQNIVRVPATKTGVGRVVPLSASARETLKHYIERFRGRSQSDRVFLRHAKLAGHPVSTHCVRIAMRRAYRRCGFPGRYGGTHVLRRTFATRLRSRGADMREIGDLLGHQDLMTTSLYTDIAVADLRVLVQPWPFKA